MFAHTDRIIQIGRCGGKDLSMVRVDLTFWGYDYAERIQNATETSIYCLLFVFTTVSPISVFIRNVNVLFLNFKTEEFNGFLSYAKVLGLTDKLAALNLLRTLFILA